MHLLINETAISQQKKSKEEIKSFKTTLVWFSLGAIAYTVLALIYFNN